MVGALARWIENARASIESSKPGRRGGHERRAVVTLWRIMRDRRHGFEIDPSKKKKLIAFVTDMTEPLRSIGLLKVTMRGHIHKAWQDPDTFERLRAGKNK
jgi:hypothetical protein